MKPAIIQMCRIACKVVWDHPRPSGCANIFINPNINLQTLPWRYLGWLWISSVNTLGRGKVLSSLSPGVYFCVCSRKWGKERERESIRTKYWDVPVKNSAGVLPYHTQPGRKQSPVPLLHTILFIISVCGGVQMLFLKGPSSSLAIFTTVFSSQHKVRFEIAIWLCCCTISPLLSYLQQHCRLQTYTES